MFFPVATARSFQNVKERKKGMSPRIKKIRRDIEGRVLPLAVFTLLIIAGLSTIFMVVQKQGSVKAGPGDWYDNDWNYRKEITLNHSLVQGDLSNFPVLISITDTDLRDNALSNGSDILFTNVSGTKLNHEIELWNSTTGQLVAWVNVTSLSSSVSTTIYMYYDYSAASNQQNVAGTWGDNYLCVQHLNETYSEDVNHYVDSSGNENHGTMRDANASDPIRDNGVIGYAYNFSNVNDGITVDAISHDIPISVSLWCRSDSSVLAEGFDNANGIVARYYGEDGIRGSNVGDGSMGHRINVNGTILSNVHYNIDSGHWYYCTLSINANYIVSVIKSPTDGTYDNYKYTAKADGNLTSTRKDYAWGIGGSTTYNTVFESYFNGTIDEVRLSNKDMSLDWINTSYNNQANPSSFHIFGEQDNGITDSEFTLYGLTDTNITWYGQPGQSVWCNSSGAGHETLRIFIQCNDSINVTDVVVWLDDMTNNGDTLLAGTVTLYVSGNNDSYGSAGTFVNGGSNITLNSAMWNVTSMGLNPFPVDPLSSTYIYARFLLAIPSSGVPDATYTNNGFKVYINGYDQ